MYVFDSFSFSLVYLPIKAPTHEQNNLNNTNTTKHIYRVPVIIYNTSNTVFCVGDAMTHHEGHREKRKTFLKSKFGLFWYHSHKVLMGHYIICIYLMTKIFLKSKFGIFLKY